MFAALMFLSSPAFSEGSIPIQAKFSKKIVYTTNENFNKDVLIKDCTKRGGTFNECGSVCDDERKDMACITVCAMTCEFGQNIQSQSMILTSKPVKVSGEQFMKEIAEGKLATMQASKYLGEKDGRVYLQWSEMRLLGGWNSVIHFAEVKDLDKKFYHQLRSR